MINIKDLIFTLPNLIPIQKCDQYINFFKKNEKQAGKEKSKKYYKNKVFKNTDNFDALQISKRLNEFPEWKNIHDELLYYINSIVLNYENYLKINVSPAIVSEYMSSTSNIRILRYKPGNEIKDHLDIGYGNTRASVSIALNDNYEGGEFTFFSNRHKIMLKKGMGMIFPAEQIWIHGVTPVTKGERYSINCFLKPNSNYGN